PLRDLAVDAHALSDLHHPLDDLDAWRLQQRLPPHRRRAGRSHPCAGDARHPLSAARQRRSFHGRHRGGAAAGAAARLFPDEAAVGMSPRAVAREAKLLLIGIPVLLWTILPVYHMVLFAISPKDSAFAGSLWPDHPTLNNFAVVLHQRHHYLTYFWKQMGNSLAIAVA